MFIWHIFVAKLFLSQLELKDEINQFRKKWIIEYSKTLKNFWKKPWKICAIGKFEQSLEKKILHKSLYQHRKDKNLGKNIENVHNCTFSIIFFLDSSLFYVVLVIYVIIFSVNFVRVLVKHRVFLIVFENFQSSLAFC